MVNTFLPYSDFAESARVLDMRRLGKQRVEAYQILRTLTGAGQGWANHPCTRLWRGYEPALARYTQIVCVEWRGRGYKDTVLDKVEALSALYGLDLTAFDLPPIIGRLDFHLSHQSNLLRKDHAHYSQHFGIEVSDSLPYVWN